MEKRLLLAFALSALVLYLSRSFLFPEPPAAGTKTESPAAPQPSATPPAAPAAQAAVRASEPTTTLTGDIHGDRPQTAVIDTDLYTATISNVGGVLTSFRPKAYKDDRGEPTELIDPVGVTKIGAPLAFSTVDSKLDAALSSANFRLSRTGDRIELEFADSNVYAKKIVTFDGDAYSLSVETMLVRGGKPVPHNVTWQGGFGDQSVAYNAAKDFAVYLSDASFKTTAVGSIKDPQEMTVPRVGLEDQYFAAMFLLPQSQPVKIRKADYASATGSTVSTIAIDVPDPESMPIRIYVGPKQEQWLVKTDPQLASVINYGYSGFIAKPLLVALLWIHNIIGNFGWSIIILTLGINLALFPLRLKQQTSMLKMQKIQPKMRTLQDKFKKLKANDPRRTEVQTEMMNLYKEHGINPMSGCLPLLLQMPFLWAIWSMLTNSIELRHAPWALWISDLSRSDPFYIMPILMAVSMIVMQKMTPTTVDPAQARMMMIMPIMFAFIFRTYQSGLMLYWLTGNMVGITQQIFINKYWSPAADAKVQSRKKLPQQE